MSLEKLSVQNPSSPFQSDGVAAYFEAVAANWNAMYTRADVWGEIHQQRLARLLRWIDHLGLPAETKAADIGCGAGLAAVALAKRSFLVEATDAAGAMIDLTEQNAKLAGVDQYIRATRGDVYHLEFDNRVFDLVVCIGVIPWLSTPAKALAELSRILRPGGYLLFTADNARRLSHLLDPATSPYLAWPRRLLRASLPLKRAQSTEKVVCSYRTSIKIVDKLLSSADLSRVHSETLGFGPFTLFHRKILSERLGVATHRSFQRLGDAGWPVFRSTGAQFLVLAQKSTDQSQACSGSLQ